VPAYLIESNLGARIEHTAHQFEQRCGRALVSTDGRDDVNCCLDFARLDRRRRQLVPRHLESLVVKRRFLLGVERLFLENDTFYEIEPTPARAAEQQHEARDR